MSKLPLLLGDLLERARYFGSLTSIGIAGTEPAPLPAAPVRSGTPADADTGAARLKTIREELGDCRRCKLADGRKNIVFGQGNPQAQLMFVGEAPGADEDEQG